MGFLAREDRLARRRNLAEILPEVKAVIVTSLIYWPGEKGFPAEQARGTHGNVSCCAWGSDYHQILGDKLKDLVSTYHRSTPPARWCRHAAKSLSLVEDRATEQQSQGTCPVPIAWGWGSSVVT